MGVAILLGLAMRGQVSSLSLLLIQSPVCQAAPIRLLTGVAALLAQAHGTGRTGFKAIRTSDLVTSFQRAPIRLLTSDIIDRKIEHKYS